MATHDEPSIFSQAWHGLTTAWDVATGNAPPTTASSAGADPVGNGAYAQASAHHVAGEPDAVGGSVKLATGGGARGQEGAPWWKPSDWISAEGGAGRFRDAGGDDAFGLWAEGQSGKTSGELLSSAPKPKAGEKPVAADYLGYEYGGPDGALGAKVTGKGAQASAQASAFNVGMTHGIRGTDVDEETRWGLAPIGPGGGARLHWGDSDNDKKREYGFGLDVGPVSFDFKTEDPLHAILNPFEQRIAGTPRRNETHDLVDLWKRFTE